MRERARVYLEQELNILAVVVEKTLLHTNHTLTAPSNVHELLGVVDLEGAESEQHFAVIELIGELLKTTSSFFSNSKLDV